MGIFELFYIEYYIIPRYLKGKKMVLYSSSGRVARKAVASFIRN